MKKLILIILIIAMMFCLVSVAGAWDEGGWDTSKVPYIKKTAAPAVTDDDFGIPYLWVDENNDKFYLLIDNTPGAAVWREVHAGSITTFLLDQDVEALTGNKTLVATDLPVQKLDPSGSDRDVTLPSETSSTDLVFYIYNTANGAGEDLTIKTDAPATIVTLGPGMGMMFSCDGTTWLALDDEGITYDAIAGTVTIAGAGTPLLALKPSGTGGADIISIVPSGPITSPGVEWDGIKIDASALDPGESAVDVEIHGIHSDMSGILRTRVPEAEAIHADGMAATAVDGQTEPGVALHAVGKIRIDYDATNLANGIHMTVLDVIVDTDGTTEGEIHVLDVANAGAGTPTIVGLATHTGVAPIKQYTGLFVAPEANYSGRRTGGGATYVDILNGQLVFGDDDDAVLVGSTSTFSEIEIILTTAATKDIKAQFFFNTAANAWTRFYPADDTDGMQHDGIIRFAPPTGWTNDGDPDCADACGSGSNVGYWIRIDRTRVASVGAPEIETATILAPAIYGWDKDGNAIIKTLDTGQGAYELYAMDQDLESTDSPIFPTVKLSGLDSGTFPYHINDSTGLANSPLSTDGINVSNTGTMTSTAFISDTVTVTTVGPTDNLDVSGVNIVLLNTGSNNVTIGGFLGGVSGQRLAVVIINATMDATLEHAEGVNQSIYLSDSADETISAGYGGWLLTCNGTHWYEESIGGGDLKDDQALYFGDGSDYWLIYDSSDTRWELWTSNGDGSDTDTMWAYIEDGTDDLVIVGALTADSVTTTATSAPSATYEDSDADVSGRVHGKDYGSLADIGDGSEDFHRYWQAMLNGTLTTFMDWNPQTETFSIAGDSMVTGEIQSVNYKTIYIDAGAMIACTTNGAATGTNEYGTNDIEWDYFAFDAGATEERVQFKLVMPEDWDASTLKVKFYWSSATGSTVSDDQVSWAIKAGALADSAVIDAALGTARAVEDTLLASDGTDLQITGATPALTVGGAASGSLVTFEIFRDTDGDVEGATLDDMTEDAWLFGVLIQYATASTSVTAW